MIDCKKLSLEKHTMLAAILSDKNNYKFFHEMDGLLTKKRFEIISELSLNENILNINSFDLTANDIVSILNLFIQKSENKRILEKRIIYEIVKISNLPSDRLEKIINEKKYLQLGDALTNILQSSKLISYDFLVLRILDNILVKCKIPSVIKKYQTIKQNVFNKFIFFTYSIEEKGKETVFLCWIDRLLYAAENREITIENYILLCDKILKTIDINFVYVNWKILNAVNYLLLQQDFSSNPNLRKYKKILLKKIEETYKEINLTLDELKDITINILAKEKICKEDYYYLLDLINITSERSAEDKAFGLKLCKYIIKQNDKQNIFCYRFIRKYFLETIFKIIKINDPFEIKESELRILISLLHIDSYYCFNREEIFKYIVFLLKSMNNGLHKLTLNNFYKYCHVIDYIMYSNPGINQINVIENICTKDSDKKRINKYFELTLYNLAQKI